MIKSMNPVDHWNPWIRSMNPVGPFNPWLLAGVSWVFGTIYKPVTGQEPGMTQRQRGKVLPKSFTVPAGTLETQPRAAGARLRDTAVPEDASASRVATGEAPWCLWS